MPPLLQIERLTIHFDTDDGVVAAVEGLALALDHGEIVGLVGESGCGKSATAMAIPRLLPMPPARFVGAASIKFMGQELTTMPLPDLRALRGAKIGVIFQDPMTALSPLWRIGKQIGEALNLHQRLGKKATTAATLEWLRRVGIKDPQQCAAAYPHELSGGMQQRVMIAMALCHDPELLIADEPTTALDVTTQQQVLNLIKALCQERRATLLITHDMGVVRRMATHVAVMYAGEIVEQASAAVFFATPLHPYARALLASIPSLGTRGKPLNAIHGQVPSALNWPPGCRFAARCAAARPDCFQNHPPLAPLAGHPGRLVRCPYALEIRSNSGTTAP